MNFTYEYSQPEEYHFSLDSIEAPKIIAQHIGSHSEVQTLKVLDLCAGCGVMGFELSWHVPKLRYFDFVEVQEIYLPHFVKNQEIVHRPELQLQFHLQNYQDFRSPQVKAKYDLVICNPPYFRIGQGKLSPSQFKNRCRFFIDSSFAELIKTILWVLKPGAKAFVLLRELENHGCSVIQELETCVGNQAQVRMIADVRGTHLLEIILT